MRDRPSYGSLPPVFAVLNPRHPLSGEWTGALGTDYVELESDERIRSPHGMGYRVETRGMGAAALLRVCRMMSRRNPHFSEFGAFMEAVQGDGMLIGAALVYVCSDPAIGRAYYASWTSGESHHA